MQDEYTFGSLTVVKKSSIKLLGLNLHFTKHGLSVEKHRKKRITEAAHATDLLLCLYRKHKGSRYIPIDTGKRFFETIIIPKITYAALIWAPFCTKKDLNRLDKGQYYILRKLSNQLYGSSFMVLLSLFSQTKLSSITLSVAASCFADIRFQPQFYLPMLETYDLRPPFLSMPRMIYNLLNEWEPPIPRDFQWSHNQLDFFVDGSVYPLKRRTACAVIANERESGNEVFSLGVKLGRYAAPLHAEIVAIILAIRIMSHTSNDMIFSDNPKAVRTMRAFSDADIIWCDRNNSGIIKADKLAKLTALSTSSELTLLPLPPARKHIRERLRPFEFRRLDEDYLKFIKSKSCGTTIRTLFPNFRKLRSLSYVKKPYIQFFHGHNRLNRYLFLTQKALSPICSLCISNAEESAIHVLFECPMYSIIREKHRIYSIDLPVTRVNGFIYDIMELRKRRLLSMHAQE